MINMHSWNQIRQTGESSCSKQALSTGSKKELPGEVKHNWWRKFSWLGMKQKHKSGREGRTSTFYPVLLRGCIKDNEISCIFNYEGNGLNILYKRHNKHRIKDSTIYEINGTYAFSIFLCTLHSILIRVAIYIILYK